MTCLFIKCCYMYVYVYVYTYVKLAQGGITYGTGWMTLVRPSPSRERESEGSAPLRSLLMP